MLYGLLRESNIMNASCGAIDDGIDQLHFTFWRISFLFLVLAINVLGAGSCSGDPHPQDKVLVQKFERNRPDFLRLAEMAREDSRMTRIAFDFTWLDGDASFPRSPDKQGITEDRWNLYKQLFKDLDLKGGLLQYPQNRIVYFIASNEGLTTGGSNKGYAFSQKELQPLVEDLDGLSGRYDGPVYKRIDGDWYLYYWSTR